MYPVLFDGDYDDTVVVIEIVGVPFGDEIELVVRIVVRKNYLPLNSVEVVC